MKRQVLKVALLGANAVLMAAAVGMVCAFLASGIAWGVGWVDDWRVPARMFGGTIDGAEIVRFRRGCTRDAARMEARYRPGTATRCIVGCGTSDVVARWSEQSRQCGASLWAGRGGEMG